MRSEDVALGLGRGGCFLSFSLKDKRLRLQVGEGAFMAMR